MPLDRRTRAAAIAATVALSTLLSAVPAAATPPGDPGLLLLGCDSGAWTMDPNGDEAQQIFDWAARTPDWSPGGTMIAFTRRDGPTQESLWVMDAQGNNPRRLTYSEAVNTDPGWFPNAERIAFSSDAGSGSPHIRKIAPKQGAFSGLWAADHAALHDPAVSPDFTHTLVVASREGGAESVWINGFEAYSFWQTTTPPDGSTDGSPDWAPASDRYAFVRDDGTRRSIYAVDLDGSDLVRLTDESLDAISPTYAADGSSIAFLARPAAEAGTDEWFDVWTMDADGANKQMVAAEMPCDHLDWQPVPDFPLVDARFSDFESAIRWAYFEGIATGCGMERFCDLDHVTRGPMATFLANAFDLPPPTEDHFSDDDGTTHEDDINRIVEAGITSGCTSSRFCPHNRVTRAQMASLLARALELPPALLDHFDDDDGQTHEANINRLAEAGLTGGCGVRRYCPTRFISRGEAVALLHRALGE